MSLATPDTITTMKQDYDRSSADSVCSESTSNAPVIVRVSVGSCKPRAGDRHPLYWFRKERDMSMAVLAGLSGLTPTQISLYERGLCIPGIDAAFRLAMALDVSVDRLFGVPYKMMARQGGV